MKKSKIASIVVITAFLSIVTTGYISNHIYQQKLAQQVFTFNVSDAQQNIRIAKELRKGNTDKIIQYLDSTTGTAAIIFTNYNKFAPESLHQDILETLKMIKNYRDVFKVRSTLIDQQKDIDKSLTQIK